MVDGHELNEYSDWGVYASGSNWVVGIHVGLEIGVTGSDWDGATSVLSPESKMFTRWGRRKGEGGTSCPSLEVESALWTAAGWSKEQRSCERGPGLLELLCAAAAGLGVSVMNRVELSI